MSRRWLIVSLVLALAGRAAADGPADNLPDKVRPVPPLGVSIPDDTRAELQAEAQALDQEIEALRSVLKGKPALLRLLPDVQVYHNAVRYALAYNEFYDLKEVPVARTLLKQGLERARALRDGQAPWATATGLVVRGYVSRIDGSVQPYGLVVPASYSAGAPYQHRLDVWLHGRGEKLTELSFINGRQSSPGEFTPPHAFVLHPYGRYCNANKFAGEIDVLEALEHVRQNYSIDANRVALRGFSMGGAGCWQLAVHYPDLWAAAAPGAGFAETAQFLDVFQNEKVKPTAYEQKLWRLYDCPGYALNLGNLPTVAYSGEIDRQKQAADVMELALKEQGVTLTHLIGPKTGHSYHPETKRELNRRIDAILAVGRAPLPRSVRFATYTLRYPGAFWVRFDGLAEHWERAAVDATILPAGVQLRTQNVTALTLTMPPGLCPFDPTRPPTVHIDGSELTGPPVLSDRSWVAHFRSKDRAWERVAAPDEGPLRKRPGLQGPIDDAFFDSFIMVAPTGQPLNELVGTWADREMKHAAEHWRRQFRGAARLKQDSEISDADIAANNLVLWGDPASNRVLAKLADRLPLRWTAEQIEAGNLTYSAKHHVPLLIYPNPLNPQRYVVLNSGFTFREYDYLNNARQVPKLPDFAVLDVRQPVTSRLPGGVVTAGFFDEDWRLPGVRR